MKTHYSTQQNPTLVTTESINNILKISIMKTLKISILTALIFMYALVNVQAAPISSSTETGSLTTAKMNATKTFTINTFIDAVASGNLKQLAKYLDEDFQQTIAYNGKSITHDKDEFIKVLDLSKNVVMNCTTAYTIVEECDDLAIVKVEMKFPTFVKTSYVTMKPNKADVWKITNVSTVYGTDS